MDRQRLRVESAVRTRAERLLDRHLIKDFNPPPPAKRLKVDEEAEVKTVQITPNEALGKVLKHLTNPYKVKKCLVAARKLVKVHGDSFSVEEVSELYRKVMELEWTMMISNELWQLFDCLNVRASDLPELSEVTTYSSMLKELNTDDSHTFHQNIQALQANLTDFEASSHEQALSKELFLRILKAVSNSQEWKKPGTRSLSVAAYTNKDKFTKEQLEALGDIIVKCSLRLGNAPVVHDPAKPTHSVSDGRVEVLSSNGLDAWSMRQMGLAFKKS
mmetsp:Transcript_13413/g.25238  ORF Transcript_13413/g.25238 Transcript_13413/m.25238 type:complete len:274 (+) Transcript_13413:768-1589(+)